MREKTLKMLSSLEKKVYERNETGDIQVMEYGPYEGDGIPPEEQPRPFLIRTCFTTTQV